jgi:hypothetical protein
MNVECYQAYLQQTLDDYQDDFAIMASLMHTGSTPIPPHEINLVRETTAFIMSYIALQLLGAGGEAVLEPRLKILRNQAKESAMVFIQMESAQTAQGPSQPDAPSTTHSALLHYKAELQAAIDSYHNNIFQLLMSSPTSDPRPDLPIRYDELRSISSPIISGLAHLITHLGGKEMSNHEIDSVTQQAKIDALGLHAAAMPLTAFPPHPDVTTNNLATKNGPPQKAPRDSMFPPDKPKSSMKAGKFFPIHSSTPPPCQKESTKTNPDDNEDDPGIYSCTINGVGDGTHLIIASFIKTNDKIQDQLLKNFMYFSELMHANINGL